MSLCSKHRLATVIFALFFIGIAASARAQITEIQRILQLNPSGGYLGIQMDDVTSSNMTRYKLNAERGVIVRSVMKGSPAEDAGLKEGDVLLEFGDFQVWSAAQLSRLVQETPPGRKVNLVVSRDGKRINLSVQMGRRDARRADSPRLVIPDFDGRGFRFEAPDSLAPRPADQPGRKPRLGVTLQPLTDQLGEFLNVPGRKGVLVVSVAEGSPSAGKLKAGDVIISADGKGIDDPEDLIRIVTDKEGDLTLKVIRDKREITVVVNLPPEEKEGKGLRL